MKKKHTSNLKMYNKWTQFAIVAPSQWWWCSFQCLGQTIAQAFSSSSEFILHSNRILLQQQNAVCMYVDWKQKLSTSSFLLRMGKYYWRNKINMRMIWNGWENTHTNTHSFYLVGHGKHMQNTTNYSIHSKIMHSDSNSVSNWVTNRSHRV